MTGTNSSGKDALELTRLARVRLSQLRLEAIAAFSRGDSPAIVARSLGVSTRTVQRWAQKLRELGPAALQGPEWPGKSARLAPELLTQLEEDVRRGPKALGYAQVRWTSPLLSSHIRRRFGLRVGDRHCLRFLRQVGVSPSGRSKPPANTTAEAPAPENIGPLAAQSSRLLSDRQLKDRALSRIRRLASAGLPLVPFASTLFDLTSEAVPQTEGIQGICTDVHQQSWFFRGLDYLKWEPAIRKYAMEDNPEESGIVPQDRRDPTKVEALCFEQMVFPNFHKLAGYNELYRHLGAHHFIGAMLGQEETLGVYTLWRDESMKPFSHDDLQFLQLAAPHIAHAVKTARRLGEPSATENHFQAAASDRLGVVVMSLKGKVLALNQAAARLFHQLGVLDGLRADAFTIQISQGLEYIARTVRTIFHDRENSAHTGAPAARIFSHASGITLCLRGFVTERNRGKECVVVLVEQGELEQHRRQRIMYRYGLSPREAELLTLLGSGLSSRDIAARMGVGKGTIKTYANRIADKLDLRSLLALRQFAAQPGV